MYNKPGLQEERLFLNTIPFSFSQKPQTCWFSVEDIPGLHLKRIGIINRPANIETIFPDLKNDEFIYTSFIEVHEGMTPLELDLNDHANYFYVKRWLNGKINHYFKVLGLPVETDSITMDNRIWVKDTNQSRRSDCWQYDRYTLRVSWDDFNSRFQLVLTYDRPSLVYKQSVAQLVSEQQGDPFSEDAPESFNLSLVNKIFYKHRGKGRGPAYRIDRYEYLAEKENFDDDCAFPVMWPRLAAFVGIHDEDAEEDSGNFSRPKSRYKKYYDKINTFYKSYLDTTNFRSVINISTSGFARAEKSQVGETSRSSQELVFDKGHINNVPQKGLNEGPYKNPPQTNIQLMFIFHKEDVQAARELALCFKNGYKKWFRGLNKYIGRTVTLAPNNCHLKFSDRTDPVPEVTDFLREMKKADGVTYFAIYLTSVGKHEGRGTEHEIYYRVKKLLMDYGIPSQCIETDKMLQQLKNDSDHNREGFTYTLQNMSIAINAKLGGIPWRISGAVLDELVVGVGAFRTQDGTHYIGSAFSFDNTGVFNSFNYFLKNELEELAGAIEDAIVNFTSAKGKPGRLIIHYYKVMKKKEESVILDRLRTLSLDIPVYIVSINKTESEDIVLFDGTPKDMMPYSGRYINLGAGRFLLCNNTRYRGASFNAYDGFPFPVKLRIESLNTDTLPDSVTIRGLIEQVYQFSRIYWKSVKQQNLPVTIKYPEMVAEIAPHFNGAGIPPQFESRLWFL